MLIIGNREEAGCSYNRMALRACIEALKAIKTDASITVYCNSDYVVDFINNWGCNAISNKFKKADGSRYANIDLLKVLWTIAMKTKANFVKVDGNNANDYNEEVDRLADWAKEQAIKGKRFSNIEKTRYDFSEEMEDYFEGRYNWY